MSRKLYREFGKNGLSQGFSDAKEFINHSILAKFDIDDELKADLIKYFGIDLSDGINEETVKKLIDPDEYEIEKITTEYFRARRALKLGNMRKVGLELSNPKINSKYVVNTLLRNSIINLFNLMPYKIEEFEEKFIKSCNLIIDNNKELRKGQLIKVGSIPVNNFVLPYNDYSIKIVTEALDYIIDYVNFCDSNDAEKSRASLTDLYSKERLQEFKDFFALDAFNQMDKLLEENYEDIKKNGLSSYYTSEFCKIMKSENEDTPGPQIVLSMFTLSILTSSLTQEDVFSLYKSTELKKDYMAYGNFFIKNMNGTKPLKETFNEAIKVSKAFDNSVFEFLPKKKKSMVSVESVLESYSFDISRRDNIIGSISPVFIEENEMHINGYLNELKTNRPKDYKILMEGGKTSLKTNSTVCHFTELRLRNYIKVINAVKMRELEPPKIAMETIVSSLSVMMPSVNENTLSRLTSEELFSILATAPKLIKFANENDVLDNLIILLMIHLQVYNHSICETNTWIAHTSTSDSLREIKSLSNELSDKDKEIEKLKAEIESLKHERDVANSERDELVVEKTKTIMLSSAKLESENTKFKDTIKKQSAEIKELKKDNQSLSETIDRLLTESLTEEDEDFGEKVEFLRSKKVVLVGGYPTVVQSVQKYLPDLVHIAKASSSNDYTPLCNSDLNIMYFGYMGHSLTYSLKSNLKFDERYLKLDRRLNAQDVIRRAYEELNK